MNPLDINYYQIFDLLLRVVVAFVLSLPIGWEREKSKLNLGLRTFPLVAVASCGYILLAETVLGQDAQAQARIIQGLMTGMGFIGGGAIIKDGDGVRGTATAASMWTTGIIGGAVAYGRYDIAILLSLINLSVLRLLTPIKHRFLNNGNEEKGVNKETEKRALESNNQGSH